MVCRNFTLLFVVAAALLVSCDKPVSVQASRADAALLVTTEVVAAIPLDRTLPVVGTLFAKDEAMVGAEVEGKVERTGAEFGDRIRAGQEIALIDTATHEAQARLSAANLARAQATAVNAEKELQRVKSLGGIASPSDVDKAQAQAEQAQAEGKAAEAAESIAKLNLDRSHVRAPFDAAVAERVVSAGDFVRVGAPLFRVVNDGVLKYIVQAPERCSGLVQKGQVVNFTVDAWPGETFSGRVFLISPQVNTTTRAFAFGALVTNDLRRLRANTFARGELVFERAVPTLVVSLDAVVDFAGVSKVFVVEQEAARTREVTLGRVIEGKQEVLSGVKPGERIVVSGTTKLYDGAKVRVKDGSGPAGAKPGEGQTP